MFSTNLNFGQSEEVSSCSTLISIRAITEKQHKKKAGWDRDSRMFGLMLFKGAVCKSLDIWWWKGHTSLFSFFRDSIIPLNKK